MRGASLRSASVEGHQADRDCGGVVMQRIARWGSDFEFGNTEGLSSQTNIVALSGSSKAESGAGDGFTLKRTSRS